MMKRYTYRVAHAGVMACGCQVALFQLPRVSGRYPGMLLDTATITVAPGMTMDVAMDGAPFDRHSTRGFRVAGGSWHTSQFGRRCFQHTPQDERRTLALVFVALVLVVIALRGPGSLKALALAWVVLP